MKTRIKVLLAAVCVITVCLALFCGCSNSEELSDVIAEIADAVEMESEGETEELPEDIPEEISYYFRNDKLLSQHYEKHGIDMGFSDKESYEAAASAVINNPDSLYKTEKEDGDGVYYLEATNEFVILSTDGYIRTYFLPDAGKKYFDKQ